MTAPEKCSRCNQPVELGQPARRRAADGKIEHGLRDTCIEMLLRENERLNVVLDAEAYAVDALSNR